MTVTMGADGRRPRAVLPPPPPDSATSPDEPAPPYTVVADRIFLEGDGYFAASGEVDITRDSLIASADSAEYQEADGYLYLTGSASVESASTELLGREIRIATPGSSETEIRALREARLTGDDLLLTSAQIVVYLSDNTLQRLVATPLAGRREPVADSADLERPVALVEDFELTADSVEVTAPGNVVERVFAAGRARSVSTSRDSLNVELLPEIARTDWLEGDTVIVRFDPVSPGARVEGVDIELRPEPGASRDERSRSEVHSVVARGAARSLYRLAPSDSTAVPGVDPPALHYVVGNEITIRMRDGQVDGMEVVGRTRGVHLEPLARRAPRDSVIDTLAVVVDTSRAVPDTVRGAAEAASGPPRSAASRSDPAGQTPGAESPPRKEEPWRRP
jgi:hypothetical protein